MSRALKASLLSALVLPGAGHLYLRRYLRGLVLAALALAALWFVLAETLAVANDILAEAERGAATDVTALADLIGERAAHAESAGVGRATLFLGVIWVVGIVDAYRLGRRDDQTTRR